MKYLLSILILSTITFSAFATSVSVTITNLRTSKGTLIIGIYNQASDFPIEGSQWKKVYVPVDGKEVNTTINLPEGEYAFAVCHDEDGDGTCNQNFLGIPTEGFAFTNNFRPKLKAPKFDDVKINVGSKDLNLSLKLIYF